MEINLETITEFINLKRSKRINLLLTVFSTIVSGFLIILVLHPNYVKGLSAFLVFLLSLAAIAPVYIFNQIVSIFLISKLLKLGLQRIANVAEIQDTEGQSSKEFIDDIRNELMYKAFYNSPARQLSELITIAACYISALLSWTFEIGVFGLYFLLTILSIVLFFLTYKLSSAIISEIKQQHFKPLISKLKKDKEFMEHLEGRLNEIERLIREKKEGECPIFS